MSAPSRPPAAAFWESPETVARFAARDPDHRLRALTRLFPAPSRTRVLDLGCAAGRNTVYLADLGFDVLARDASRAMVKTTCQRLNPLFGPSDAERRVQVGAMDRLEGLGAQMLDLLVALGVYSCATSQSEWSRALTESHRVLARGGLLLAANFTDAFDPGGRGLRPVPGEAHLYDGMPSGRAFLVSASLLDAQMALHGFRPLEPTITVRREMEGGGVRVTANGLYLRL